MFQKKVNESACFGVPQEVMNFNNGWFIIYTKIAVDQNDNLYISAGNGTHLFLTNSSDQGNSWATPRKIAEKMENWYHDIAVDLHNNLFIVYDNASKVYITNSSDQGQNWSIPRIIGTYFKFSIDFDPVDNLIFLGSNDSTSLILTRSNNQGYDWSPPLTIRSSLSLEGNPILRTDKSCIFHVFYFNHDRSYQMTYQNSFNGSAWSAPLIKAQVPYPPYGFGAVILSQNNSIIIWCEQKYGFFFQYYSYMYSLGLPENYFTPPYLIDFSIGLIICFSIYVPIVLIIYFIQRKKETRGNSH